MKEEMDKTLARVSVYLHQIEINLETIRTSTEIIEKARSEIGELCYNLKLKEVEREEGITGIEGRIGVTREQIVEYIDKMHEIDMRQAKREEDWIKELIERKLKK